MIAQQTWEKAVSVPQQINQIVAEKTNFKVWQPKMGKKPHQTFVFARSLFRD